MILDLVIRVSVTCDVGLGIYIIIHIMSPFSSPTESSPSHHHDYFATVNVM